MIDRPNPLTIHLSDDELAFLEKGATKIGEFMEEVDLLNFSGRSAKMTPEQLVVWLVEKAHGEFLDKMEAVDS